MSRDFFDPHSRPTERQTLVNAAGTSLGSANGRGEGRGKQPIFEVAKLQYQDG